MESLRAGEVAPEVHRCPDGHYRRVIWGIGPYIADYPEQLFLACVVKDWCCRSGFIIVVINVLSDGFFSCQALKKDLDGELSKLPRSRQLTEELIEDLPIAILWDLFGIVADVVVCPFF